MAVLFSAAIFLLGGWQTRVDARPGEKKRHQQKRCMRVPNLSRQIYNYRRTVRWTATTYQTKQRLDRRNRPVFFVPRIRDGGFFEQLLWELMLVRKGCARSLGVISGLLPPDENWLRMQKTRRFGFADLVVYKRRLGGRRARCGNDGLIRTRYRFDGKRYRPARSRNRIGGP